MTLDNYSYYLPSMEDRLPERWGTPSDEQVTVKKGQVFYRRFCCCYILPAKQMVFVVDPTSGCRIKPGGTKGIEREPKLKTHFSAAGLSL